MNNIQLELNTTFLLKMPINPSQNYFRESDSFDEFPDLENPGGKKKEKLSQHPILTFSKC